MLIPRLNTTFVHLDLHRQSGIIGRLIPTADLQGIHLQPHFRAVSAAQLQAGGAGEQQRRDDVRVLPRRSVFWQNRIRTFSA